MLGLLLADGAATGAAAIQTGPVLDGTVLLGGVPMEEGTVVLHQLSDGSQGELDSLAIDAGGRFSFALPRAPDPARGDVFFASVRHHGVLYFGPAITEAPQLDSIYEVLAYDTLLAPAEGLSIPVQSRSVFFEPDAGSWRVTDLFQLRNDEDRTLVTRPGGIVWRHALPAEATDVTTGEGELSFAAAEFEDGDLVVRAAVPPGERLFVVRYRVPSLDITVPNRGPTEALDILIREPAPPIEVPGLELLDRIELEAGSTYMRFTGVDVPAPGVTIVEREVQGPPRVEYAALLLALVLGAAGLWVLRPGMSPAPAGTGAMSPPGAGGDRPPSPGAGGARRDALLYEIARLDEDHAAGAPTDEERAAYQARRAELLERIRSL